MYIIAGLGNPGIKYDRTRHNAGFMTIDTMAERYGISLDKNKHKAILGQGMIEGHKVLLVKPQTFMNLSGESIGEIVHFYDADPESELIVFSDDINLAPGMIRVRKKGSAGGHNGLKNIIAHVGTDAFKRVRIGVGDREDGRDLADHVLSRLGTEDMQDLNEAIDHAIRAAVMIMDGDADGAMNLYNKKMTVSGE